MDFSYARVSDVKLGVKAEAEILRVSFGKLFIAYTGFEDLCKIGCAVIVSGNEIGNFFSFKEKNDN
jgi:hypothetical protein